MIPNDFPIVLKVWERKKWDTINEQGIGEFCEAVVEELHKKDGNWGHLKKYPGQTQIHGHAEDSALYKVPQEGGKLQSVDFLVGARSANANPGWQPDVPRYSLAEWIQPTITQPNVIKCELGCTLFWGLAGLKFWPAQLDQNLEWISNTLKADFVRVLGVVGGTDIQPDPWEKAGAFLNWSDYPQLIRGLTDHCFDNYGLKVAWTLFGGRSQAPTLDKQLAVVDQFAEMSKGREHKIRYFEMWNEYWMNGGTTSEMRAMARRMRSQLQKPIDISLSSPQSVAEAASQAIVEAEIEKMYGGDSGANLWTPHWDRSIQPTWGPKDAKSFASAPTKCINNEPIGPNSSVRSTHNPLELAQDYQATVDGGGVGYVYHTDSGVWADKIHSAYQREDRGNVAVISSHRNSVDIAKALVGVKSGQRPFLIDDGLVKGDEEMALPSRDEVNDEMRKLHEFYRSDRGLMRAAGLVVAGGVPDWEGLSAWIFDVYVKERVKGKSREEARAKYEQFIMDSDEWKVKHGVK